MKSNTGNSDPLSEVLRQLIAERLVTGMELASLAGVSDSAVGRYVNNEGQPKFETVRQWVKHHRDRDVKLRLARVLTAGTPIRQVWTGSDLDVNKDGKVDRFDAMRAMVHASESLGNTLKKVEAALNEGEVANEKLISIIPEGYQAIEQIATGLRVLSEVSQREPTRRRAKPLK